MDFGEIGNSFGKGRVDFPVVGHDAEAMECSPGRAELLLVPLFEKGLIVEAQQISGQFEAPSVAPDDGDHAGLQGNGIDGGFNGLPFLVGEGVKFLSFTTGAQARGETANCQEKSDCIVLRHS